MAKTRKAERTVLTPSDVQGMLDLGNFLKNGVHSAEAALVGPDGQTVPLPLAVYELLQQVADAALQGKSIVVAPVDQKLTTQEAADFLGISRPTLVKLVENGEIPFERTAGGKHRKLRLQDVLSYQESVNQRRRETLKEMAEEVGGESLLAYEYDMEAVNQAVKRARLESQQ
ncbi:hypothetical protein CPHO_02395 [Corynebacterium phocae]|uniref:Helix-turn-helix domain-containing protein n=1 Tax=Corynebacterium phocae TaxID=161895 RepID=A0A1L7D1B5_9CORY|nr:helix-turn-helix domain-containing protein [Corynebacterium phocae]APT91946.1 hypothetical protein CPHO_02395 [Corynebacterium phocae]KAA8726934.1 helix-turn-helix domain-containing protein [Corynebacterium phocae]